MLSLNTYFARMIGPLGSGFLVSTTDDGQQFWNDTKITEAVESALPDMTFISLDEAAYLKAWVNETVA